MKKYKKGNITLQIRVPVSFAVSILGRLYGMGLLSRGEYMSKLEKISQQEAERQEYKTRRLSNLIEKAQEKGRFFNKKRIYF